LHSLPVDEARAFGLTDEPDPWGDWLKRAIGDVRQLLSDETFRWIEKLHVMRPSIAPPTPRVIHGDVAGIHLIFDPDEQCLAGIIDFADAAIGDPARDFPFESLYGRDFL